VKVEKLAKNWQKGQNSQPLSPPAYRCRRFVLNPLVQDTHDESAVAGCLAIEIESKGQYSQRCAHRMEYATVRPVRSSTDYTEIKHIWALRILIHSSTPETRP
jgi:hypothetical protein